MTVVAEKMNKGLFFFVLCLGSLPSDSWSKRPEKKQARIHKKKLNIFLNYLSKLLSEARLYLNNLFEHLKVKWLLVKKQLGNGSE